MIRALKKSIKYVVSEKYIYLRQFSVNAGDIVIDLGANVGEISEYFVAKGAIVKAYEPNPHAFKILEKRLAKKKNITLYQSAVSNFTGTSNLYLFKDHMVDEVKFSQASSLQAEKENVSEDSVEVDVVNIKDILAEHDKIKLIKIDIEGGEYDIMDDIIDNIEKIDHVLLETHEKKNKAFRKKNDLLLAKIKDRGLENKIYMDWF